MGANVYVYVDGSDLDQVEAELTDAFQRFLSDWSPPSARLINDKSERTPDLAIDEVPNWNLGINVDAGELNADGLRHLVEFLRSLSMRTSRKFVVGTWDAQRNISEDLCFVGSGSFDVALRLLQDLLT